MKNVRTNLIAGIIVSVLVLQGWFAGQAISAQAPAAEANAKVRLKSTQRQIRCRS